MTTVEKTQEESWSSLHLTDEGPESCDICDGTGLQEDDRTCKNCNGSGISKKETP